MRQGRKGEEQIKQLEKANELVSELYKSMLKNQTRYESRLSKMNKENRKRAKQRLKMQEQQYKTALKLITKQYKEASKYMTKSEKEAHKLYYKNRVKDFKRLSKETERVFEDIGEQAEESADKAMSKWEEFADKIANMTAGISLTDELTSGIEDQSKSLIELKNSIMKQTGLNRDSIKEMDKTYQSLVKEFDGLFSMSDMYEAADYLAGQGVKTAEDILKFTKELKKIEAGSDLDMNQLDSFVQATQKTGVEMSKWANQIQALQTSGLQVSSEALVSAFDDNFQNVINKVGENNPVEFSKRMDKILATTAAIEDSWGDTSGIFDLFESIRTMSAQDLGSNTELNQAMNMMGLSAIQLQNMLNEGRVDEALTSIVKGVETAYSKYGDSAFMSNYVKSILGSADLDQVKKLSSDTISNSVSKALEVISSAESVDKLQEVADNAIVSWFDSTMNKLKATTPALFLDSFSNATGISGSDLLLGNALLGNPLGKGAGALGRGIFGKAKSLLTAGGGATATTSLVTSGVTASSLATVGGALVGATGVFSGLLDWFKSFKETDKDKKSEKRWQGSTKLGMVGAGAGIGTMIAPGIGTAIGAGIGGLSALFTGSKLGSWFKGKWDGFTSIFKDDKSVMTASSDAKKLGDTTSSTAKSAISNYKNMEKGLKSLANTASSTSSNYSRSMSQIANSTPSNISTNSATNPNSSQNGGKKNEFKWWNPFTWFNGSHKDGLDKVPFDGYRAILHKDEAVLTKQEANEWRNSDNSFRNDSTAWFSKIVDTAKASAKDNLEKFWSVQKSAQSSSSSASSSTGASNPVVLDGNTQAASFTDKNSFIEALGQIAQKNRKNVDILPSFVVAQSLFEGAWPLSSLAKKNNLWGIKAGKNWSGDKGQYKTAEYKNGKKYYTNAWFRHYPSLEAGFSDHAKLFTNDRYKDAIGVTDPTRIVSIIKKGGYFTDSESKYANSINSIISANNLTRFDKQLPAYAQGTPWVPHDQVALIHKGEMIVPADQNPINKVMRSNSNDNSDSSNTIAIDNSDIVNVIKWAVSRLEAKLDNVSQPTTNNTTNYRLSNNDSQFKAREVFSF